MDLEKLCVSTAEPTFNAIIGLLDKYDFVEIRIDHADLSDDEIRQIFSQPKTLIATCREGRYNRSERLARLEIAIEAGASYVDVETEADDEFIDRISCVAEKHDCKLIVSYHNFDNTPAGACLRAVADKCISQGADLVKLVTASHGETDNARILSLYSDYDNITAFAMGRLGRITRIASIYAGAPYTYVSVSGKPVADGQLSFDEMVEIISKIRD